VRRTAAKSARRPRRARTVKHVAASPAPAVMGWPAPMASHN
jgi:hypothetical protein